MCVHILLPIASALFLLESIVVLAHNFPWIVRLWRLRVHHLRLFRDDLPILIVSDIHLGNRDSLGKDVLRIASKRGFHTLVIAGDLLDKRTLFSDKIFDLLEKFLVGNIRNVLYVPSSSSHDIKPLPTGPISRQLNGKRVVVVPEVLALSVDGCVGSLYITHGDYSSRNGIFAHIIDAITLKVFSKPFTGTILRKILETGDVDWVIHGHSHLAVHSQKLRIVDTGCWVKRPHESVQRAFAVATCRNGVVEVDLIRI
ncbi:MAG: metallophosphoesterase [Ignisphaera sp.]